MFRAARDSCRKPRRSFEEAVYYTQLREAKIALLGSRKKQQQQQQQMPGEMQPLHVPAKQSPRDALRKQVAHLELKLAMHGCLPPCAVDHLSPMEP